MHTIRQEVVQNTTYSWVKVERKWLKDSERERTTHRDAIYWRSMKSCFSCSHFFVFYTFPIRLFDDDISEMIYGFKGCIYNNFLQPAIQYNDDLPRKQQVFVRPYNKLNYNCLMVGYATTKPTNRHVIVDICKQPVSQPV